MPSPNGGWPLGSHSLVELLSGAACMASRCGNRPVGVVVGGDRRAEHGHHRVAHELHHRAALVEDGPVHLRAVRVELAGSRLGSACSAIVE